MATPNTIIKNVQPFFNIDPQMQLATMQVLLEIIKATARGELIGIHQISERVGLTNGTASRNVAYWADGAPQISKSMGFVRIDFHPTDRRLRVLSLTPKGAAFVRNNHLEDTVDDHHNSNNHWTDQTEG